MKLIVGLGNPGKKYEQTRHNAGFMVIDAYAKKHGVSLSKKQKFKGEIGQFTKGGETILLLKPLTYMNLSGESVRAVREFYGIHDTDILIVYDDLDLSTGKLRIRQKGSAGGHNGIKSIIEHLHSQNFHRLRIGIDRHPVIPTVDYVLGRFSKAEKALIDDAIVTSMDVLDDWIDHEIIYVMNKYN
mgnify:FL=1